MTRQIAVMSEPIPGYTIEERIGGGGYGEVYKALAPGDLHKAVKLVYGYHDEEGAARELQALERIKEVRHPFLMSIERVEVCEGQLVIVTELADMSLRDCFEAHRESGRPGIPRDELLVYLRDAADALDYMCERHSLQHLDVKPENLLLVGDRLKVGDFGLVKDLQHLTGSLMSGLTPVYAPPELFRGEPNYRSDQYSLAIVFQEMLTGVRPFRGNTAAHLTAQHLNDAPDLEALPASDRAASARALAKNPEHRFGRCREFVDQLLQQDEARETGASHTKGADHDAAAPAHTKAVSVLPPASTGGAETDNTTVSTKRRSSREVDLPKIDVPTERKQLRPTLFLALGGTGAKALRKLRHRLAARFGPSARIPAFRMLYVDTDLKAILRASQGDETNALDMQETLAMPLRRTQDYGADKKKFLNWLSRRWLYNIPRSLQTEGRRPLGRVALVDHFEKLLGRLHASLGEITDSEALCASAEMTGIEFESSAPRVFIVASLSGGTGGGMVLDVAYTVRRVLRSLGLSEDGIHGILTHATMRGSDERDLAIANAYATLKELHHFSRPDAAFPGAAECELPAMAAGETPFPSTSIVQLGDDLDEGQLEEAIDELAEYLYLDSTSECGALFDGLHDTARRLAPLDPAIVPVRTFSLHALGGNRCDVHEAYAMAVGRALLSRWIGIPKSDSTGAAGEQESEARNQDAQIDDETTRATQKQSDALALDSLLAQIENRIAKRLGSEPNQYVDTILAKSEATHSGLFGKTKGGPPPTDALTAIDELLGGVPQSAVSIAPPEGTNLRAGIVEDVQQWGNERRLAIREFLRQTSERSSVGIRGARGATSWLHDRLQAIDQEAEEAICGKHETITQLRSTYTELSRAGLAKSILRVARREAPRPAEKVLQEYFSARLHETALIAARHEFSSIDAELSKLSEQLPRIERSLGLIREEFLEPVSLARQSVELDGDVDSQLVHRLVLQLSDRLDEMVQRLDEDIRFEWLDAQSGLAALAEKDDSFAVELTSRLQTLARKKAMDELDRRGIADAVGALVEDTEEGRERLRSWLNRVRPAMAESQGAKSYMLAVGQESDATDLEEFIDREIKGSCNVVRRRGDRWILGFLGEQIALASVAGDFIRQQPEHIDVAGRLHTRIDIDFSPIE